MAPQEALELYIQELFETDPEWEAKYAVTDDLVSLICWLSIIPKTRFAKIILPQLVVGTLQGTGMIKGFLGVEIFYSGIFFLGRKIWQVFFWVAWFFK